MTAGQGKFDALTKELITHVLGFEEGEENFVRSEQFVLSNLLYHHCLAVNSHAVRRSIEGLALKFTIHGQQQRAQRLNALTAEFIASTIFVDHYETDLEWSLLSLLLHLSNNPTQVPHGAEEGVEPHPIAPPAQQQQQQQGEQLDWGAYLREGEPDYVLGPEEPLSDWSCEDDSEDSDHHLDSAKAANCSAAPPGSTTPKEDLFHPLRQPHAQPREVRNKLHRAKSWLSAKTQLQYWGSQHTQHLPSSDHPAANVAKLWEADSGCRGCYQQVSEWVVMREVVWGLMCPTSSHVFVITSKGSFTTRPSITLASLTPAATKSLLEPYCKPLEHLRDLDSFMQSHRAPSLEPPTPATILAYTSGLQHWRHSFQRHLTDLEDAIMKQETICTLLWLEGELHPWLRTLTTLSTIHRTAITAPPPPHQQPSPKSVAVRLLGCLCEGVESAGEAAVRGVLLRLLLHTLRHYLAIMHSWLMQGELIDPVHEFIVHRDEFVSVYNERFWQEAFTITYEHRTQTSDTHTKDPVRTIMKILSPILSVLTSVGKTQELLAALNVPPLSLTVGQGDKSEHSTEGDSSLEEVVVRYIKEAVDALPRERKYEDEEGESTGSLEEDEEGTGAQDKQTDSSSSQQDDSTQGNRKDRREDITDSHENKRENTSKGSEKDTSNPVQQDDTSNSHSKQRESSSRHGDQYNMSSDYDALRPSQGQTDSFLWSAFTEPQMNGHNTATDTTTDMDDIARLIESMGEVGGAVSVVHLVSSALQPLLRHRHSALSSRLTQVLLDKHRLAQHCQVLRSVLLMEAGDIMHDFYSHLFAKLESGEGLDTISLSLHLQYCVSRLYPEHAQCFSISLATETHTEEPDMDKTSLDTADPSFSAGNLLDITRISSVDKNYILPDSGKNDGVLLIEELGGSWREERKERVNEKREKFIERKEKCEEKEKFTQPHKSASRPSLNKAGIPLLYVHYQAPWPINLVLTEAMMRKFNRLFNFSLSLKRVTNGLERLKFKELASWNLFRHHEVQDSDGSSEDIMALPQQQFQPQASPEPQSQAPLQSRLHRLQLLRQWLLCFSRELHDHFANTAFLPYHKAVEELLAKAPPVTTIIKEHDKLLNQLTTKCLMGRNERTHPLQVVLNKVFFMTQRLGELWLGDVSVVSCEELTHLETQYAKLHRYLVNFLTTLITRSFMPHLEGLTCTLVDTVPLLTHR